jgi:hypothetical protein
MSQSDDSGLKEIEELTVEGFDVNDDEFKEMLNGILTQSISESESFSAITTGGNSQQLIESQPNEENQQTGPWPPVEQETAMTQEFENKLNPQIFIEIINNIITKLGEKYTSLDLISKIKIILSNPMLLGALITSLAGTFGYVRSFWSNPFNLYTNILGGIFAYITTNILTNPEESSKVIALLDANFISKYYGKVLEIEQTKASIIQGDILNNLDEIKIEEEKKSLEVLSKTNENINKSAEIKKSTEELIKQSQETNKIREVRTVINEALLLKSGLDVVKLYNFLSKLLPKDDKVSKDIVSIVFDSTTNSGLFGEIVDEILQSEKDDMSSEELDNLLKALESIVREHKKENPDLPAGGGSDRRRLGGKRKTHKKSSKSKKSKKNHKKHHKKTAHKKRGSRRK